jgi:polysaccharide export outer membrane protein
VKLSVLFLAIIGLLSACGSSSTTAGPVISSGERYTLADSQIEDYKLGVGDKIRLTVFNEATLSGEFSVGANGVISLPLVGDVEAIGHAPQDVATAYQDKLAAGYLREPKVSVEVTAYRPFFILGEVKAPGQYPYVSGLTVMNAIATAQGFTPRAQRQTVFIRRSGTAEQQSFALTPDLRVYPGDTIRLGERYF